MRLEVIGDVEDFAICWRDARVDPSTGERFCGLAFCVHKLWIGDPHVDCVRGTVALGLQDLCIKEGCLSDEILFQMTAEQARGVFFTVEKFTDRSVRVLTEVGQKYSMTVNCECFDGFYLFAVTHGERIRLFHIDWNDPRYSWVHETNKQNIFNTLAKAADFLRLPKET